MNKRMIFAGLTLITFSVSVQAINELFKAISENENAKAEELLKAGANPNGDTQLVPLLNAINGGNLEGVKLLLKYGANIHQKGAFKPKARDQSAIDIALNYATNNSVAIIKLLLQNGADANEIVGHDNERPLHAIAHNAANFKPIEIKEITKLLLDHGANVTIREKIQKMTPLELAQDDNNQDFIDAVKEWQEKQIKNKGTRIYNTKSLRNMSFNFK